MPTYLHKVADWHSNAREEEKRVHFFLYFYLFFHMTMILSVMTVLPGLGLIFADF